MANDEAPKWEAIRTQVIELTDKWTAEYSEKNPKGLAETLLFVFTFIFGAVGDLIELVEVTKGIAKTAKEDTVISAFKYAYSQVNPNLPWIPEPFETKLENWMIDNAMPAFIHYVVKKFNDKGIFAHG